MFQNGTSTHSSRYTFVAITLHWVMAALLIFMIWLGHNMEDHEARFQLHKSIGISLLVLTAARILWRLANPPPPLPDALTPQEKRASHYVHIAFYALMVLLPLGGWLLVSISKFQVPTVLFGVLSWPHLPFTHGLRSSGLYDVVEFLHGNGGWVLLALLALHVAGALKHQFTREGEAVLQRMIPALSKTPLAPEQAARGAGFAFGAPLAAFALIAMIPILGNACSRTPSTDAQTLAQTPADAPPVPETPPNWTVDFAASEIRFSGVHNDEPFTGVFADWDARVAFFPEDVTKSAVLVSVKTASATTGRKLYDDTLKNEEWFAVSTFPEATIRLTDFVKTASGYSATANMVLKGQSFKAPLTFTLSEAGGQAELKGETKFSRKTLNLGQISDPAAGWVSDDITVTVSGQAKRTDVTAAAETPKPAAVPAALPKPAPKAEAPKPVAAPKPAPKAEAPKPAPKVEAPKPAPAPKAETPKPAAEAPINVPAIPAPSAKPKPPAKPAAAPKKPAAKPAATAKPPEEQAAESKILPAPSATPQTTPAVTPAPKPAAVTSPTKPPAATTPDPKPVTPAAAKPATPPPPAPVDIDAYTREQLKKAVESEAKK